MDITRACNCQEMTWRGAGGIRDSPGLPELQQKPPRMKLALLLVLCVLSAPVAALDEDKVGLVNGSYLLLTTCLQGCR